jgi:hypothetical protein
MVLMSEFKAVGVFHFGVSRKGDPYRSLLEELQKAETRLTDFLLVLPETFNRPHGYYAIPMTGIPATTPTHQ